MNLLGYLTLVVFGVTTCSYLRYCLSRFKPTWWVLLIGFLYNSLFGMNYMAVVKSGDVLFWEFSGDVYNYVEEVGWLTISMLLFHAWASTPCRPR